MKLKKKPAAAACKGPFDKPASKTVKAWCQGGANRVKEKKIDMKEEKIDVTEVERASTLDLLPNGDRVQTLSTEIDTFYFTC